MLEPDLVRHRRRRHGEGPRLQELDTRVVPRPLDFSRAADEFLAFAHEECELSDLLGDAIERTLPKVVISTFDGDPLPLIAVCADKTVDGVVRS